MMDLGKAFADQEEKRQQAQLDLLKLQYENEGKKRDAELQALGKRIDSYIASRASFLPISDKSGPTFLPSPLT